MSALLGGWNIADRAAHVDHCCERKPGERGQGRLISGDHSRVPLLFWVVNVPRLLTKSSLRIASRRNQGPVGYIRPQINCLNIKNPPIKRHNKKNANVARSIALTLGSKSTRRVAHRDSPCLGPLRQGFRVWHHHGHQLSVQAITCESVKIFSLPVTCHK